VYKKVSYTVKLKNTEVQNQVSKPCSKNTNVQDNKHSRITWSMSVQEKQEMYTKF